MFCYINPRHCILKYVLILMHKQDNTSTIFSKFKCSLVSLLNNIFYLVVCSRCLRLSKEQEYLSRKSLRKIMVRMLSFGPTIQFLQHPDDLLQFLRQRRGIQRYDSIQQDKINLQSLYISQLSTIIPITYLFIFMGQHTDTNRLPQMHALRVSIIFCLIQA